jgi:predicted 3-demethylubiquinone-9 3-methyltransferase (glyoxalase superfamily)
MNRKEGTMQKITPFLWFDNQAEEAMNFYTSIFNNSKIGDVSRYGDAGPGPKGTVMSGTFQLDGQGFYALNGGPHHKFTPAISFFVNCATQKEIDECGASFLKAGWFLWSWTNIRSVKDSDGSRTSSTFVAIESCELEAKITRA